MANTYEKKLTLIREIIARYIELDESYVADNACSPLSVCHDMAKMGEGRIQAYKIVLELLGDYFPEV